jgi:hypothetical protein
MEENCKMANKNAYNNLPDEFKTANSKNAFKKNDERTKEIARKGGLKAQENARKKREMRESLEILLSMNLKKGAVKDTEKIKNLEELQGQNITAQDAILYSLILTALNGGRDGVAAFKQINEVMTDKNDVTTLDVRVLNGLSTDELKKLADADIDFDDDIDEDYDDFDGDID